MGLFIRQNENRSQLQERLAAELREKARARLDSGDQLDQVENSQYLKNTEATSQRAWIWLLVLAIIALFLIVIMLNG